MNEEALRGLRDRALRAPEHATVGRRTLIVLLDALLGEGNRDSKDPSPKEARKNTRKR